MSSMYNSAKKMPHPMHPPGLIGKAVIAPLERLVGSILTEAVDIRANQIVISYNKKDGIKITLLKKGSDTELMPPPPHLYQEIRSSLWARANSQHICGRDKAFILKISKGLHLFWISKDITIGKDQRIILNLQSNPEKVESALRKTIKEFKTPLIKLLDAEMRR